MQTPIPNQFFCDLARRSAREIVPGIRVRTFWQANMLLSMVTLEPNAVLPPHHHPEEQCGAIIAGELKLTLGEETRVLGPGDAYTIPGYLTHAGVAGAEGATVVDVFAPVREDYKFE